MASCAPRWDDVALTFTKLHPTFVAEASPIDLRRVHDAETLAQIRAGMDEHAILVFRDQPFTDDEQIAFAQRLDGDLHSRTGSAALEGLRAHHSVTHSRWVLGFDFSESEHDRLRGAVHPLVRTLPRSGRRSLYVAAHASRIVDWPTPEGRLLLLDLIEHATQPAFVYRHHSRVDDLVIWDNRCTMHRPIPFDDLAHNRQLH